jgi:hypothetical protein
LERIDRLPRLRWALADDQKHKINTFEEIWQAYKDGVTVDTWDYAAKPVPGGRRGHYWVLTPELVKQLVEAVDGDWWELVGEENSHSKVGNGFTLVYKLDKPAADDPRLCVPDSPTEAFYTKAEAEAAADGLEVAKIADATDFALSASPENVARWQDQRADNDAIKALSPSFNQSSQDALKAMVAPFAEIYFDNLSRKHQKAKKSVRGKADGMEHCRSATQQCAAYERCWLVWVRILLPTNYPRKIIVVWQHCWRTTYNNTKVELAKPMLSSVQ